MLCQECHKYEAIACIELPMTGGLITRAVCNWCFERQSPEVKDKAAEARISKCQYCGGRPCRKAVDFPALTLRLPNTMFLCPSCSEEFYAYTNEEMNRPVRIFPEGYSPQEVLMAVRKSVDEHMRQWVADAENRVKFARIVEKPQLLADPVFTKANYLQDYASATFGQLLQNWKQSQLIRDIVPFGSNRNLLSLRVGWVAFWAFDLDEKSNEGVLGRDEFLERVKYPVRRPPANMSAFTSEQQILAKGVTQIQVAEKPLLVPPLKGGYEIVELKTIGWYAAQLVPPKK